MVSGGESDPGPGDGLVVVEQAGSYASVAEAGEAVRALGAALSSCSAEGASSGGGPVGADARSLSVEQGAFSLATTVFRQGSVVVLVQASGEVEPATAADVVAERAGTLLGRLQG